MTQTDEHEQQIDKVHEFITSVATNIGPADVYAGNVTFTQERILVVIAVVDDATAFNVLNMSSVPAINTGVLIWHHAEVEIWGYTVSDTTFREQIWPRPCPGGWWDSQKVELSYMLSAV